MTVDTENDSKARMCAEAYRTIMNMPLVLVANVLGEELACALVHQAPHSDKPLFREILAAGVAK